MSASAVCFLDSSALLSEVCAQSDKLPDYDVTALHLAAYHGQSTDAAQLLQNGADPLALDRWMLTPLHVAALGGQCPTLKIMLDNGAPAQPQRNEGAVVNRLQDLLKLPSTKTRSADFEGAVRSVVKLSLEVTLLSPLHYACTRGDDAMAELLLQHGALVNGMEGPLPGRKKLVRRLLRVLEKYEFGARWDECEECQCSQEEQCRQGSHIQGGISHDIATAENGDASHNHTMVGGDIADNFEVDGGNQDSGIVEGGSHGDVAEDSVIDQYYESLSFARSIEPSLQMPVEWGWSPLHCCAATDSVSAAQLLCKHGANVDVEDCLWRKTPLHVACQRGAYGVAKVLLTNGARLDKLDNGLCTALSRACQYGNADLAKLLVGAGSTLDSSVVASELFAVKQTYDSYLVFNSTQYACAHGSEELVEFLLDSGAPVEGTCIGLKHHDSITEEQLMYLRQVLKHETRYAHQCRVPTTNVSPLHIAALWGRLEAARILVDKGAYLDVQDGYQQTPLHLACLGGHVAIVGLLLDSGAKADQHAWGSPHFQANHPLTPLYYACGTQNASHGQALEIAQKLLAHGAAVDGFSRRGKKVTSTPFHAACKTGNVLVINLMLENGARMDVATEEGDQILHFAADLDKEEVVDSVVARLLDHGANIHAKNQRGETALHLAAGRGYCQAVRTLLQRGARVSETDFSHRMPLHRACIDWHTDTVCVLLEFGALCDAQDEDGFTPLDLGLHTDVEAMGRGELRCKRRKEVVTLLEQGKKRCRRK